MNLFIPSRDLWGANDVLKKLESKIHNLTELQDAISNLEVCLEAAEYEHNLQGNGDIVKMKRLFAVISSLKQTLKRYRQRAQEKPVVAPTQIVEQIHARNDQTRMLRLQEQVLSGQKEATVTASQMLEVLSQMNDRLVAIATQGASPPPLPERYRSSSKNNFRGFG